MEKDQPNLAELFLENIIRNNPTAFRYLDIKDHPLFGWAVGERLLSETESARFYPCNDCEQGCQRVVDYPEDDAGNVRIRALCPDDRMVEGKDLSGDDVKRYRVDVKRFYRCLCEANGIAFDTDNPDDDVVYLGTRDFDGQPVLFYIAARINNKAAENELMKIAVQKPGSKKCIIIPPRIKLAPALETRLNNMNLYPLYTTGNVTDGKFRFRHYALGAALKIRDFSFDELTADGYLLIVNPHNSDGCFLGSRFSPTRMQFHIIRQLAENASRAVSKDDLFDLVYDAENVEDVDELSDTKNPLDSHLKRLRKVLGANIKKGSDVPRGTALIKSSSRKHGTVTLNLPPEKVLILPR